MKNRYTSILLLAVMGGTVSGLYADKPKYFTAGNVFAALGLAGATYYAYDPSRRKAETK